MNGKTSKYYHYEKTGSGRITIPISLAKGLGWKHKDDIEIVIKNLNGNLGLFLYKKEKK